MKAKKYKDLNASTLKQQIKSPKIVPDSFVPALSDHEEEENNDPPSSPPNSTPCSLLPDTLNAPSDVGRQSLIQLAPSENIRAGPPMHPSSG